MATLRFDRVTSDGNEVLRPLRDECLEATSDLFLASHRARAFCEKHAADGVTSETIANDDVLRSIARFRLTWLSSSGLYAAPLTQPCRLIPPQINSVPRQPYFSRSDCTTNEVANTPMDIPDSAIPFAIDRRLLKYLFTMTTLLKICMPRPTPVEKTALHSV